MGVAAAALWPQQLQHRQPLHASPSPWHLQKSSNADYAGLMIRPLLLVDFFLAGWTRLAIAELPIAL